jgi:hypothetical protein
MTSSDESCSQEIPQNIFGWKTDHTRPSQTALRSAFVRRFDEIFACAQELARVTEALKKLKNQKSTSGHRLKKCAAALIAQMEGKVKQWSELVPWCYPHLHPLNDREAIQLGEQLLQHGASFELASALAKYAQKRGAGAPARKRKVCIQALDLRLVEGRKKWFWGRLAGELCPCGAGEHTHRCEEQLRLGVYDLEKFIQSCGIDLGQARVNPAQLSSRRFTP